MKLDFRRFWWPHGLRHRCATFLLLGLRVPIPPTVWTSVFFECCLCVIQVEASATGRFLVQGNPTECVCVIEYGQVQPLQSTPRMSR